VAATYEAIPERQKELYQEILFAIWCSLKNFRNDSSSATYIYRVAHNTGLNHVRKQTKEPSTVIATEEMDEPLLNHKSDPYDFNHRQQQSLLLEQSIRKLSVDYRQLIALSLEGLSYPEIAGITGLTANNVGVSLVRARKKLTELMR
jgi:RNA polymerase sigma-70 factor (ECF subfamily)